MSVNLKRVGGAEDRLTIARQHLEAALRLLNVCRTSVEALASEHSDDVAATMGTELFLELEHARQALEAD